MQKISEYEGKITKDIVLDLNIFLPEIAKKEKLILMNLHYDGVNKTKLSSGQIVTSIEETKRPVAIPGKNGFFETRRDIIYDIYLQFKMPEIKIKGEFFVLERDDDEELFTLKATMNPAKFLISVQNVNIDVVIRLAEIDKQFKIINHNNGKKYNFRRPNLEFDYSFDAYSIKEVFLPTILRKSEEKSETEEENNENSNAVGTHNKSAPELVSELGTEKDYPTSAEDKNKRKSETNELQSQAETEEKHIDSVEEVEALNLNPLYASLVQKVLDQIKTKDISFQKNLYLLVQRLTKFVDKNTVHMPSIFEIGYEMKMLFGYFTTEEYSFKSVKEEQKFLKWVEEIDVNDFIKSIIAYRSVFCDTDGQKIKVYLDSLTPTSYTPRKYMVDNYEMFYYGNLARDVYKGVDDSYWKVLNKYYINIPDAERESTLKDEEQSRLDTLREAFTNWIKILNLIASFDGLQRLYQLLGYKIADENGRNSENQIYWDAKIIKTEDMVFNCVEQNINKHSSLKLNWSNLSFSGLSLAKITLSDINIVPIESIEPAPKRTDFRYDVFLKIHVPWMVIFADYLAKQDYESGSDSSPGKIKLHLQAVDITLKLGITEIDKNYIYVSRLQRPHYFRNPSIDFRYTIDQYKVFEHITPSYKGYKYNSQTDNATYYVKKSTAKRAAEYFIEMLFRRRKTYARLFTEQIKFKFMAHVIPMPSIFEIIKVIKFILNFNPLRSLEYYNESETKDMEKKFFEILSNKANVVKFIENALKDARKYFSPRDTKMLKSFKESCLNEDEPVDELFKIYNRILMEYLF